MEQLRNARIKIAIRLRLTREGVKVVKTKRVLWRDAVAWVEGHRVMDCCGEVWEVKPLGNGDFEAIG
jgi:hypothetical protein